MISKVNNFFSFFFSLFFFQFSNVLQRPPQDVAVHQLNSIFASSEVLVEVQKLWRTNTPEVFINDKDGGVLTGSSVDLLSKFTVSYMLMENFFFDSDYNIKK